MNDLERKHVVDIENSLNRAIEGLIVAKKELSDILEHHYSKVEFSVTTDRLANLLQEVINGVEQSGECFSRKKAMRELQERSLAPTWPQQIK